MCEKEETDRRAREGDGLRWEERAETKPAHLTVSSQGGIRHSRDISLKMQY